MSEIEQIRERFRSGNNVPVPDIRLSRKEWEAIESALARRLTDTERKLREAQERCERLENIGKRLLAELSIMDESEGIAGWHLNGDVSPWDEGDLPGLRDELGTALSEPDEMTQAMQEGKL